MEVKIKGIGFEEYEGKVKVINHIIRSSTKLVMEDSSTYGLAIGVGLTQGLKYNGSFKRGAKAGMATVGVLIGGTVIQNVVINLEEIKKA